MKNKFLIFYETKRNSVWYKIKWKIVKVILIITSTRNIIIFLCLHCYHSQNSWTPLHLLHTYISFRNIVNPSQMPHLTWHWKYIHGDTHLQSPFLFLCYLKHFLPTPKAFFSIPPPQKQRYLPGINRHAILLYTIVSCYIPFPTNTHGLLIVGYTLRNLFEILLN